MKLYDHPLLYRLVNELFSLGFASKARKKVLERFYNKKILEVGIGYESPLYPNEIGVDISLEMLKHTKDFCEVCQASAYNLPFRDNSFDVVFFSFSFCVLEDPFLALKEAKRVGKRVIILEYIKPRWLPGKLWKIGTQTGALIFGSKDYSKILENFKKEKFYGFYGVYSI